jgi:hypothetical protein
LREILSDWMNATMAKRKRLHIKNVKGKSVLDCTLFWLYRKLLKT